MMARVRGAQAVLLKRVLPVARLRRAPVAARRARVARAVATAEVVARPVQPLDPAACRQVAPQVLGVQAVRVEQQVELVGKVAAVLEAKAVQAVRLASRDNGRARPMRRRAPQAKR